MPISYRHFRLPRRGGGSGRWERTGGSGSENGTRNLPAHLHYTAHLHYRCARVREPLRQQPSEPNARAAGIVHNYCQEDTSEMGVSFFKIVGLSIVMLGFASISEGQSGVSYQDTVNYIVSNTESHIVNFAGGFVFDTIRFDGCHVHASGHGSRNSDITSTYSFNLGNAVNAVIDDSNSTMISVIFPGDIADNTIEYPNRGPTQMKSFRFRYFTDDVEVSRRLANAWSHAISICKNQSYNPSDPFR